MDDLIAFLNARLDEDKAAAEDVGAARIETGESLRGAKHLILPPHNGGDPIVSAELDSDLARHIARHDPARVLRQVAAIRFIIRMYEDFAGLVDLAERAGVSPGRSAIEAAAHRITLRFIAAIWDDHPDYQEEWR